MFYLIFSIDIGQKGDSIYFFAPAELKNPSWTLSTKQYSMDALIQIC